MATNKFAGTCYECHETVAPGKGNLSRWYNPTRDREEWIVCHTDTAVCTANNERNAAERKNENALKSTVEAITKYIEAYGELARDRNVMDGELLYDGRYDHVGKTIVVDAENTIWLNWHDPTVDGMGIYTYMLTSSDDDGFGNSNNDIVTALRNWKNGTPTDTQPFTA